MCPVTTVAAARPPFISTDDARYRFVTAYCLCRSSRRRKGGGSAWVTTVYRTRGGAARSHRATGPRVRRSSRRRPGSPRRRSTRAPASARGRSSFPLRPPPSRSGRRVDAGTRPTSIGTGVVAATAGSAVQAPARRTARAAASYAACCGPRVFNADHSRLGVTPFVPTPAKSLPRGTRRGTTSSCPFRADEGSPLPFSSFRPAGRGRSRLPVSSRSVR